MAISVIEKACTRCGVTKPLDAFHRDAQKKDGRALRCKVCKRDDQAIAYRDWTPDQHERHRESVLRHRYGTSSAVVQSLYEQQEGCCAICGRNGDRPSAVGDGRSRARTLCVDHDHATGQVRGLLCVPCNSGMGKLGDSVERLIKAAAYLVDRGGQ